MNGYEKTRYEIILFRLFDVENKRIFKKIIKFGKI